MQSSPPIQVRKYQPSTTIKSTSPRICRELPPSEQDQPTEAEILEFGEIIGIDIDREPQLLHLAKEGLVKPLPPNWKPCRDPSRGLYYYFNTVNNKTQWEHPLNELYKQKVVQERTSNNAMNQDPLKNKMTLKDFPPVRKTSAFGTLAAPPSGINNALRPDTVLPHANRLAPLKPIGRPQPIQQLDTTVAPARKAPLALEEGRKLVPPSWIPDEEPPSVGESGGMSVQRISSEESVSAYGNLVQKPKILNPPVASTKPVPVKSNALKVPIKAKGNVRFNIENDDIELKFETSSRASTDPNESSAEETSKDNESDAISDDAEDVSDHIASKPSLLTPVRTKPTRPITATVVSHVVSPPARVTPKIAADEQGAGDDALEIKKKEEDALMLKMAEELATFKQKLAEDQSNHESSLKRELEQAVEKIRAENHEKLAQAKETAGKEYESEVLRLKADTEKRLADEVEGLEKDVKAKKSEIVQKHEQVLKEVSTEIQLLDRDSLFAEQKKQIFDEISTEIRIQSEALRKSLLAEQQSEIERLKASHRETLKKEWNEEESKLREVQRQALEQLREDFSAEKATVMKSKEIHLVKESTNHQAPPSLAAALEEKERELLRTKRKYKSLQHKYTSLKDEVSNFPPFPPEEQESFSVTEDSFNNSIESHPPITSDRLTRALGALEILREQIIHMDPSSEPPLVSARPEKPTQPVLPDRRSKPDPTPTSGRTRKSVSGNVFPTKRADPDPDHYQAVREAKAFIKSQRHRLLLDEPSSGGRSKVRDTETTESSGIGSLKRNPISTSNSPRSPLNSKVAKDIDTILSSLKKLDAQMQSLWTMVGHSQGHSEPQGFLTPLIHPTSAAAMAQYNIMCDNGALDTLQANSWHPPITNADLRSRYTVKSKDPMTSAPVVPNSSVLNNLEFNQASKHKLEDEIQNFEALQEHIWKTYGPAMAATVKEDSIKAKTKDLRDWLHKF